MSTTSKHQNYPLKLLNHSVLFTAQYHISFKMQWSLFLLILMGRSSFLVAPQLYEYHFVNVNKTWSDAQKYCRDNYTDLATVFNMADMERLRQKTIGQAWIGLYNQYNDKNDRVWHWSLPEVEFNNSTAEWNDGEPDDKNNILENCVIMTGKYWRDTICTHNHTFICYNATQTNEFYRINEGKSWLQAQKHCREYYTDLISGLKQLKDHNMNESGQDSGDMWIGLFRDTWRWSDGSSFSFRNWLQDSWLGNGTCAVTTSNISWMNKNCTKSRPFFCYDDKVILINESKTWEEALYYCRENHHDLVSITNLHEQRWVQEKAKMAKTSHVWLGLRYTCTLGFWFWISDEAIKYTNWDTRGEADKCYMSGAMDSNGQHKWFKKTDSEEFNFICSTC